MAEFGVKATELSAPQGAGARPIEAVKTPVANLGFLADVAGMFMKDSSKDQDAAALDDYANKLDKINQGLETGSFDEARATAEMRKLYSRAQASRPHLVKQFKEITDGVRGFSELGEAEKKVAEVKALRREQLSDAVKNGWAILPGMSDVDQDKIVAANSHRIRVEQELSAFYKKTEHERSTTRFNQEQNDREQKELTTRLLAESTGLHIDAFSAVADNLLGKVRENPSLAPQAKVELSKQFSAITAKLQAASGTNPELAASYRTLFNDLNAAYTAAFDSDPTKASSDALKILENEVNVIKMKAQRAALLGSKRVQAAYVQNTILSNSPTAQLSSSQASNDIMVLLAGTSSDSDEHLPSVIGDPENEKTVIKTVRESTQALLSGKFQGDTGTFTQQNKNAVNNILKDVGKLINEPGKMNPRNLSNVMDWISDPSFGAISKQGMLNADTRDAVKNVILAGINQPAQRMLSAKLGENVPAGYIEGSGSIKVGDMIKDVKFSGANVSFEYDESKPVSAAGRNMFRSDMSATEKAISRIVRASAHLEGHTDYQKAWEVLRKDLLPDLYKAPKAIEVGTVVKAGDGTSYKYIGGPDGRQSSWQRVTKPTPE